MNDDQNLLKKLAPLVVVVIIVLGVFVFNFFKSSRRQLPPNSPPSASESAPTNVISGVYKQKEIFFGQSGSVIFLERDGKTRVLINLPQPATSSAAIRAGPCQSPGATLYPLNTLTAGHSDTTLETTIDSLLAQKVVITVNSFCADLK